MTESPPALNNINPPIIDNRTMDEPPSKKLKTGDEPGSEHVSARANNQIASATGLHSSIAALFNNDKWSDLMITCREREWKCHRMAVCLQSPRLAAMEITAGVIDLGIHEADIVDCMLHFLYTNAYTDCEVTIVDAATQSRDQSTKPSSDCKPERSAVTEGNTTDFSKNPSQAPLINAKVYALAEFYDLPALKTYAVRKYKQSISLRGRRNFPGFVESLAFVPFETTADEKSLTGAALDFAVRYAAQLLPLEDFRVFCKDPAAAGFVLEMMTEIAKNANKECTKCNGNGTNGTTKGKAGKLVKRGARQGS